jgi:ectoine hydroxylase-related dioxygenase (phytanoyl-CoA dioxygenase family)
MGVRNWTDHAERAAITCEWCGSDETIPNLHQFRLTPNSLGPFPKRLRGNDWFVVVYSKRVSELRSSHVGKQAEAL